MKLIVIVDAAFVALSFYVVRQLFRRRRGIRPPGPKGLPFIGNVADFPTSHEWLTFSKWGEHYGSIMSVTLLGQPIVILNSYHHAMELLDRKSSIYSDRPVLMMGGELVGWNKTLALTRYGPRFRKYRRRLASFMGTRALVQGHHGLVETETKKFLRRVLDGPDGLPAHIRKTAGCIILKISHGYSVQEGKDDLVDLVDLATEQFSLATSPGAFLVDVLPILRYIPTWFPGASFKNIAASWKKTVESMADEPHSFVKKQMSEGSYIPNYTSNLLDIEKPTSENEDIIKWSAASLYSGGADTVVSAIYSFFLAMTLYPEVQQKAKNEIDAVIGKDRLPELRDHDTLPYMEALVKEVFRFMPVAPLGIVHVLSEDDVYEGYYLEKGTYFIPNIWYMLHDPNEYADPMTFNPDRFLGEKAERDPRDICFGFGRRICPGLNLADASVWLSCAKSLAAFDITKVKENGEFILPVVESTSGTISHPKPFKCSITPRSDHVAALIPDMNELLAL